MALVFPPLPSNESLCVEGVRQGRRRIACRVAKAAFFCCEGKRPTFSGRKTGTHSWKYFETKIVQGKHWLTVSFHMKRSDGEIVRKMMAKTKRKGGQDSAGLQIFEAVGPQEDVCLQGLSDAVGGVVIVSIYILWVFWLCIV